MGGALQYGEGYAVMRTVGVGGAGKASTSHAVMRLRRVSVYGRHAKATVGEGTEQGRKKSKDSRPRERRAVDGGGTVGMRCTWAVGREAKKRDVCKLEDGQGRRLAFSPAPQAASAPDDMSNAIEQ